MGRSLIAVDRRPVAIATRGKGAWRFFTAAWLAAGLCATAHAQNASTSSAASNPDIVVPAQSETAGLRPDHLWTVDYLHLVLGDTTSVLSAPARWDQEQWLEAGAALAGVGATAAFDRTIRDHVQARRTAGEDRFMTRAQNFNTFYVLGGFAVWGELGGDTRAKNVAMDGLASSIIASGLITPVLKFVVGRERPYTTSATFKFKPFSGNYSFPSGHATQAFAVATTIAEHYPVWWVEGLAYGSAALIGYARIEQNAHFASDVVAGSLIGWSVARAVVQRNNGPVNPRKLSWSPYAGGNGAGLMFFKSF
jgi:membrane-associated phospholipid phosphatase